MLLAHAVQLETNETKIPLCHSPKPVFFKPLEAFPRHVTFIFHIYFITLFYLVSCMQTCSKTAFLQYILPHINTHTLHRFI